jgi:anti-sigma regulatory factor (Ser/Thr protein kinase)
MDIRAVFDCDLAAPAQARQVLAQFLQAIDQPSLVPDAGIVASELMTNAIEHGNGAVELRISWQAGLLRIEVSDQAGSENPRLRQADDDDFGGRGLALVHALSDRWGWLPNAAGKTVWAELGVG